ncbi:MAG TPA: nucleotide sugar dehydrogenase, partial [Acidimicrobiales bacterium]
SPLLDRPCLVVGKSTVPVGTARRLAAELARACPEAELAWNPEFLREGSAVHDFLNPDRVVIGAEDQGAAIRVAGLYLGLAAPLQVTDPASAETIKYASNAFLATKISFVNAIAAVCEAVGADVNDVVLGMGYDKRIGNAFLRPGPGWGGSCFPKDSHALVKIAEDAGYDFGLLKGVIQVNEDQFERVAQKIIRMAGGSVDGKRLAVWGLTFKARTDDLRDSPALDIIRRLQSHGAVIQAYDPSNPDAADSRLAGIEISADPYAACAGAEVLAILTEWDEFKWLDFDKVGESLAAKRVVDARNLVDRTTLLRRGFTYEGIGRT